MLVDFCEHAFGAESDMTAGPPDDLCASFDVVDGDLSPAARIGRVVAVVAHDEDVTRGDFDGAEVVCREFMRDGCERVVSVDCPVP